MSRRMARPRKILVLAAAGVVLAGCGSGSSGTASKNGTNSTKIVKVMVIGQLEASTFSTPEIVSAVQARADRFNAQPNAPFHVQVLSCNDQDDPNVAASCAREAVADQVAAVVGAHTYWPTTILPILEAATIPYVGAVAVAPIDYTSPIAYPLDSGVEGLVAGAGYALAKYDGCKKVENLRENTAVNATVDDYTAAGVKEGGGRITGDVVVSSTEADPSPYIEALVASGTTCVSDTLNPTLQPRVLQVQRQIAPQLKMASNNAAVPLSIVDTGVASGMLIVQLDYPLNYPSPAIKQFLSDMKTYEPKAAVVQDTENAWGAMNLFLLAAVKATDPASGPSVNAALQKLGTVNVGIVPPFTIERHSGSPLPELFNSRVFIEEVTGKTETLITPNGLNVGPAVYSVHT